MRPRWRRTSIGSTAISPAARQAEVVAGYNAAKTMADGEWGAGTAVVAPVGQVFETAGFADGLYANDKERAGAQGRELAAMTLYYTIYGAFIADEVTYA